MNAKGIINGVGANMFSPGDNAARQEALIIAVRMVEKLKGKTLDYTQGGTPQSPGGNASIVGKWVYNYEPTRKTCVFFFDEDGAFIMASIENTNWFSGAAVRHGKGNYQINGTAIVTSNLVMYQNSLSGWCDVPMDEIDENAFDQKVRDIRNIMNTGTRAEVEALMNPNHQYYHQPSNQGWKAYEENPGENPSEIIEFSDSDHIRFRLFDTVYVCTRVR